MTGDIVAFDPRTTITQSGYIKSRFLDDKLSAAILLGYAAYLKEGILLQSVNSISILRSMKKWDMAGLPLFRKA